MNTATAAMGRQTATGRMASERKFYTGMAIFMAVTVFAGFSASFYLRGIVTFPRPNPTMTPLIYVHAAVFTCWMLLFIVQTRLIAAGRRDIHMKLGIFGMLLAVSMLLLMDYFGVAQIARVNQPPMCTPQAWFALSFSGFPTFALFIAIGWLYRRQAQVHKRFMLLAALIMMEPAIGGLPVFPPGVYSNYTFAFLAWATIVPLMIWDRRSLGRVHWATVTGASVVGAVLVLRFIVWQTRGWEEFASELAAATA